MSNGENVKIKVKDAMLQDDAQNSTQDEICVMDIGEKVYINTITYHYLGEVAGYRGKFVLLKTCSWIPQTDQHSYFLSKGTVKDAEPIPGIFRLNVESICSIAIWAHELPTKRISQGN